MVGLVTSSLLLIFKNYNCFQILSVSTSVINYLLHEDNGGHFKTLFLFIGRGLGSFLFCSAKILLIVPCYEVNECIDKALLLARIKQNCSPKSGLYFGMYIKLKVLKLENKPILFAVDFGKLMKEINFNHFSSSNNFLFKYTLRDNYLIRNKYIFEQFVPEPQEAAPKGSSGLQEGRGHRPKKKLVTT
uniref:Tudor domain-containing protein n=1 Tax=Heterorhabditis bacteriophora TaxID=37862 RepID=A0A1I7WJE8_HETBA